MRGILIVEKARVGDRRLSFFGNMCGGMYPAGQYIRRPANRTLLHVTALQDTGKEAVTASLFVSFLFQRYKIRALK
jgi:hypothetical protein